VFVRPCWRPQSEEEIYAFIETNPWGILVNNGENGPFATNLPFLLDRSKRDKGVLIGHIARANEHASALQSRNSPALAIFQGPYSYVTASWYPNRDMPPTYYYTAVHCYGRIKLQPIEELERWLEILTNRMESQFSNGWRITEIDHSEITRRLPSILGFELEIEQIEGKFKLGQDEPKKDAMAVCEHLARARPSLSSLADQTNQYNADRPDP